MLDAGAERPQQPGDRQDEVDRLRDPEKIPVIAP
jgi:hypothetical protein